MSDTMTDSYILRLEQASPLREPVLRAAIRALQLPPGSRGLDAGCGIGGPALWLAEALGPAGQVVGLDLSAALLRHAETIVRHPNQARQTSFQVGDLNRLPFAAGVFDWAWSADCAGYPAGELLPALRELARVVRPGGCVAILAWSSQQLLPGHQLLEARLNATCSAYAPYLSGQEPSAYFLRAGHWFRAMGLQDLSVRTFVGECRAPLSPAIRIALASLMEMLWGMPQPGVAPDDWAEYQRLCLPQSPDFILDLADYYGFFTYTMFSGRVPG